MRSKSLIIVFILAAGLALAYFLFIKPEDSVANQSQALMKNTPTPAPAAVSNDLPNMPLINPDGSQFMAKSLQGKVILVFFQPDCDHCQREAVQIRENIEAFHGYSFYFISTAPFPQINQFAQDYQLSDNTNVYFVQTTLENILKTVGPIKTPSLYIYSGEGRLKKNFNGETSIDQILPYI